MAGAVILDQDMTERLVMTLEAAEASIAQLGKLYEDANRRADQNTMFSISQACVYLGGVSHDTITYYRKLGLPYYKKGKDGVWYRKGDIDAWLATGRVVRRKHY